MREGKWERVKAAAVIAGFLAETTGREEVSEDERKVVDGWVWEKMREIDFLRDTAESR